MKKEEIHKLLAIPAYGLYHIKTLEQSSEGGYLYDIVPDFKKQYNRDERQSIVRAIEEALANPDFDYKEILPDLPFEDEDIKTHLKATLNRLKKL